MKVWKDLFGKGDKIHADEIAVAPGRLLGGAVIIESGNNTNGSYIRIGDGTQMCWGCAVIPGTDWTGSGDKYWSTMQSIPLPKSFSTTTGMIFLGSVVDGATAARSAWLSFFKVGTSSISSVCLSGWGVRPDMNVSLHWQAIGRWK